MCNSSDLSAECANPYETRSIPKRLLLYDKHPGGIGTTSQVNGKWSWLLITLPYVWSISLCLLVFFPYDVNVLIMFQFWILVEAIPFRKGPYLVGPDNKINVTVKRLEAVSLSTEFYLCYSDRYHRGAISTVLSPYMLVFLHTCMLRVLRLSISKQTT